MLNKDFLKWVVISFLITTPIAYYAMHKWLKNFAYDIVMPSMQNQPKLVDIFAVVGLLALGIALVTVSFQSGNAATQNPIKI